ncbi:hypothetical protein EV356DRAFT_508140 [Viridothelium virens]|uniref:HIG1 domain-containing protein n=1 Tax=Viridothelium virens TaxID=1048519 RepID=A0A6A6GYK7_VIRVR|nr:hypothetical protein EV356DRAFT_508140 [Viridothelium virens]
MEDRQRGYASGAAQSSGLNASLLSKYKFVLLAGCYVAATGFAFLRVHRQPYSKAIKAEQYETIFKGTTLIAVLAGIALNGGDHKSQSRSQKQNH